MWGLLERRLVVAFDARSVSSALVRRGLRGARVAAVGTAAMPEGVLVPSAFERNLVTPREVERAVREALGPVPAKHSAATVVLPHGVARVAVLDLPPGSDPAEYARFRLAASVPRFASDAIVDFVPLDRGRILAAAVLREIVAEYEEAAASVGLSGTRIDLAPLAAAVGLRRSPGGAAASVLLVLGDVAFSLLVRERDRLVAVRARRRDRSHGEAERLRLDALRTALEAGVPGEPELLLAGSGARSVLDHLSASGYAARLLSPGPEAGPLHEAAGRPWLAAAWS